MFLVDTNVLSMGAPTKAMPPPVRFLDWMDRNGEVLFLSVITVGEIESGIARCRRTGAHAKARRSAEWLDTVLHLYGRRILSVDVAVARRAGVMGDPARGRGQEPEFEDLAIAATAAVNGYGVLTRNLRHVLPLGVEAFDPLAELPGEVLRPG